MRKWINLVCFYYFKAFCNIYIKIIFQILIHILKVISEWSIVLNYSDVQCCIYCSRSRRERFICFYKLTYFQHLEIYLKEMDHNRAICKHFQSRKFISHILFQISWKWITEKFFQCLFSCKSTSKVKWI